MIFIKVTPDDLFETAVYTIGIMQKKTFQPIYATIVSNLGSLWDDDEFTDTLTSLHESIKQRRLQ